jgi:hypothetical protein
MLRIISGIPAKQPEDILLRSVFPSAMELTSSPYFSQTHRPIEHWDALICN